MEEYFHNLPIIIVVSAAAAIVTTLIINAVRKWFDL